MSDVIDLPVADAPEIAGSKGSSKGATAPSGSAASSPNTLRSKARARLVEILGEGEIAGLVNGARSVYFDATPLQNADGSFNFTGVDVDNRLGLPDQEMLRGAAVTSTPYQVGVEFRQNQEPPIRTISDKNADAVLVIVQIPSLVSTDAQGALKPWDLDYVVEVRPYNGQWTNGSRGLFRQQKTTSPYQHAHRVELPPGGHPWDVRCRRVSVDAGADSIQATTIWEAYSVLVEGKFTYPNTACVSMQIDAEQFGPNLPQRFYDVKGLIIWVPSNYDPEARSYNGIWDGTFKRAWSNNPAWVFFDLLTNPRYGLGEFVDIERIDKWSLYEIAQYCDQTVPDGFGGRETRYTYNGAINTRDEAYKVLQNITNVFRGMAFWSLGQVFATADMPRDIDKTFSPANVIGGAFSYSGTAKKARHTVALVSWNDPQDNYKTAIEVVIHDEGLARFGWRQTEIQAVGCTSRGQAYRVGKWTLDTEHSATETVEFECGLDALADDPIRPGHVIAVADPRKAQTRIGGRIQEAGNGRVVLDRYFEAKPGESYRIHITLETGKLQTLDVMGWEDGGRTAVLAQGFAAGVVRNATYAVTGTDVAPRQYRVLSVREEKKNTFKITALAHDPNKFARVDEDIILPPIQYTRPRDTIRPPTNLKVSESQFFDTSTGAPRSRLTLSWTPSDDFLATGYAISASTPDSGSVDHGVVSTTSKDFDGVSTGTYTFYVSAVSRTGRRSEPVAITFEAKGWAGLEGPEIVGLQVRGGGKLFSGQSCALEWDVKWAEGVTPYQIDFVVRVFELDTQQMVSDWIAPGAAFTYTFEENVNDGGPRRKFAAQVRARDLMGNESKAASIVVENPAPDTIKPEFTTVSEIIFVDAPRPSDTDFVGMLAWVSETPGINPRTTAPTTRSFSTNMQIPAIVEHTYYIVVAGYDQFGETGLNYSPEYKVRVTNKLFDPNAPEIPTGLALTTEAEVAEDGTLTGVVRATWNPVTTENFGRYEVAASENDGSFINFGANEPAWEYHGFRPGTKVSVKVRSISKDVGVPSDWSEIVTIAAALNSEPPDNPSDVAVVAAFQTAQVSWTAPAAKDLDYVEVWASDSATDREAGIAQNGAGTASAAGGVNGSSQVTNAASGVSSASEPQPTAKVARGSTFYIDSALPTGGKRWYWLRSVNSSGVAAVAFVGPFEAVSARIIKDQIDKEAIDASKFAAGIEPVGIWQGDALPAVKDYAGPKTIYWQKDGQLWRLDTRVSPAVWSNKVEATSVTGQLTNDQLADIQAAKIAGQINETQIKDGAITTGKIRAGSVTADQMAASSVTANAIRSGAVTTDALQAGAVVAGKIQAGAISTDQLAANAITTEKLRAGAISADKLAVNSVYAANIASGQVIADKIGAGAITADKIDANAIQARHISAGAINASMITLGSSSATLANWLSGGDNTKINGGYIETNSINTNSLRVGSRMFRTIGISFQSQRNSEGVLTGYLVWTSGAVIFQNDNGLADSAIVNAGSIYHGGGNVYVWWNKTAPNSFAAGDTNSWISAMNDTNCVLVASCSAWTGVNVYGGGTIIDGTRIVTKSIFADQIAANQIQAGHIAAGSIRADHIAAGAITAGSIGAGTITASSIYLGNDRFILTSNPPQMRIFNGYNRAEHVSLGYLGTWTGDGNDYGIIIRDQNNGEVLRATRSIVRMTGAIIDQGSIGSVQIGNAAITSAKIQDLEVDTIKVRDGAISNIVAGSWSGDSGILGITCRSASSRIVVMGLFRNDPNASRGNRAPGSMMINWDPNGDSGRRQTIEAVPKNMWINPGVAYYWGTTMTMALHQPGAGYHTYSITTNGPFNDSCALFIIEIAK